MEYKRTAKAFFSFLLGLVSSTVGGVFCRMVENGHIRAKIRISGDIGVREPGNSKWKARTNGVKKMD